MNGTDDSLPSINHTINFNYQQLCKGINLQLNKNKQGNYIFDFKKLSNNQINDNYTFIQSLTTNQIRCYLDEYNEFSSEYNFNKAEVKRVVFKQDIPETIINKYPTELSDKEIINNLCYLYDQYETLGGFELLKKDRYEIKRNDYLGTIEINIFNENNTWTSKYQLNTSMNFLKNLSGK